MTLRVGILTSLDNGSASFILNQLPIKTDNFEIISLVKAGPLSSSFFKKVKRKLNKVISIGIGGAILGVKMRSWYTLEKAKSIETICETKGLIYKEFESLGNLDLRIYLKEQNLDVLVSLGNGYIPKSVFSLPKYGSINIHHEVLPEYQNAQPIIWQLYNGSNKTGYSIHQINSKIDQGKLLLVDSEIPMHLKDNMEDTVRASLPAVYLASAEGLERVLNGFQDFLSKATIQEKGNHYTTPSRKQFNKMVKSLNELNSK